MKKPDPDQGKSPSRLITERIAELGDWRGAKTHVKLTFAKGASLKDPAGLFNASLDGNARRAIDLHEGDKIEEAAFKEIIRAAVRLNAAKAKK
jgi:hypothetical protein